MRFFNRIAFKVCSIIILVELAVFVVTGVYYVSHFSEEMEKRVRTEIQTPGLLISQGVLTYDAVEEKAILKKIVGSEFEDGLIVGLNRRVFYATNKEYVGRSIDEIPSLAVKSDVFDFSTTVPKIVSEKDDREKFLHCFSPLFAADGKTPRFFLYLKLDTTWIQQQKRQLAVFFAISSMVCILVTSVFILFVLNGFIFSKLARLTKAYDAVKQGVFKNVLPGKMLGSKDEIGVLSRAFSVMTENLSETTTSIDNLNKEIHLREQAERKLMTAKETAEEATEAKSLFLANMSHEIRTPLNGVLGMTDLLLGTPLNEKQTDFAQIIKNSGQALLSVINDILDYSKIEAGKLDFETTDFHVRSTLEDITVSLALCAHSKGIELVSHLPHDVPTFLRGDPVRFRQVITNLANNALKFTAKGEVVIRIDLLEENETAATLRVSVTDTGIGIPADRLGCLFQSFSQVDPSNTRTYGGTGLGLAISKKLCEMMGGQIGVNSQHGKGSEFWFTAVFEKASSQPDEKPLQPHAIRGKRVLVVDDNATNRKVISTQLSSWGCLFEEAADGAVALDMLLAAANNGQPYDIAIVDMLMPVMDGAMLGLKIKGDPLLRTTRLVMLTSLGQHGDSTRMKAIGFSACLTKPIKQAHLFASLNAAVRDGRPENEPRHIALNVHNAFSSGPGKDIRILVAEDNKINQKVIMNVLSKTGCKVDVVSNGAEVIEALSRRSYHIVLMDVQMPIMDGIEATAHIRDPRSPVINHDIPIIALTAYAMKGDREKCESAGMNDYAVKPIDPEELFETIRKWTALNPPFLDGQ